MAGADAARVRDHGPQRVARPRPRQLRRGPRPAQQLLQAALAGGLAGVGEGGHAELGRELHVVVSLVRLAAGESCTIAITYISILLLQATTNLSSECGSTDTRAACRN